MDLEAERKAIIYAFSAPAFRDFALNLNIKYQIKNAEESIKARKEGNALYVKKKHTGQDHQEILYYYNESIAYAPSESEELMYAYSNRAYLLMHLNKYNEALDSLDKALLLADSIKMKLKLYCQKGKCLAALGSSKKYDVLQEIDQIFKKSKLSVEDTILISDVVKKTKSAVASIKQFKPNNQKFLEEKKHFQQIIIDREKVDPLDFVEIKLTKNMGKGLFAKTDFKTGDLVLVEKPCLIAPNLSNQYVYCSNCLAVAWTGIPCETCHDYIFCSLKCKEMAWQEYHRTECSIMPYLILCDSRIPYWNHIALKLITSLMNDQGTIDELKSKLKISKNHNVETVNDQPDQKTNLFNAMMRLSHNLPAFKNNLAIECTIKTLICLVKYTSFFPEKFRNMQYDAFSNDEDLIFIGSLLLRLTKISSVNGHIMSYVTGGSSFEYSTLLAEEINRIRGYSIGLISSMTNHSCAPNIKRCFSDDMKYSFHAMKPIAKGTQLLDSYCNPFYEFPLMHRKKQLAHFACQCVACKEDWPALLLPDVNKAFISNKVKFEPMAYLIELGMMERIYSLINQFQDGKTRMDKYFLQTVAKMVDEVANVLPQPNVARCKSLQLLSAIYEKYYSFTEPFENFCPT